MKKNIRVRRIHWEKRPIKHTPSFQFEFVSIVGSQLNCALGFTAHRCDYTGIFRRTNKNPVAYATSQSLSLSPVIVMVSSFYEPQLQTLTVISLWRIVVLFLYCIVFSICRNTTFHLTKNTFRQSSASGTNRFNGYS